MKHNRKFLIHRILRPEEGREEDAEINEETSDGIRNNKLCPLTDASMLHNQMGECWKTVDFENSMIERKEIFNKNGEYTAQKLWKQQQCLECLST